VPLHVTQSAKRDLKSIWAYIAADSRTAADPVHAQLTLRFDSILRNPQIGKVRSDIADDMRGIPVGRYLILYIQLHGVIYIMRVLHGARDIRKTYQEEID